MSFSSEYLLFTFSSLLLFCCFLRLLLCHCIIYRTIAVFQSFSLLFTLSMTFNIGETSENMEVTQKIQPVWQAGVICSIWGFMVSGFSCIPARNFTLSSRRFASGRVLGAGRNPSGDTFYHSCSFLSGVFAVCVHVQTVTLASSTSPPLWHLPLPSRESLSVVCTTYLLHGPCHSPSVSPLLLKCNLHTLVTAVTASGRYWVLTKCLFNDE